MLLVMLGHQDKIVDRLLQLCVPGMVHSLVAENRKQMQRMLYRDPWVHLLCR